MFRGLRGPLWGVAWWSTAGGVLLVSAVRLTVAVVRMEAGGEHRGQPGMVKWLPPSSLRRVVMVLLYLLLLPLSYVLLPDLVHVLLQPQTHQFSCPVLGQSTLLNHTH